MDSATWRGRIVSQLSCQTRRDVFRGLNNQSQMELEKRSLNHRITAKRFSATSDIKQRLEWYKRRAGKDYETAVRQRIAAHSVTSPIEQLFLLEWHYMHVEERLGVALVPQHKIDADGQSYIVDFFISKPGQSIRLVIELDGHDFHEKTRAQVAKDKTRERALIRQGFTVLRFSGSEIARNSRRCIGEVIAVIDARLRPA
jgi:very-short-patch-repair endonuclease